MREYLCQTCGIQVASLGQKILHKFGNCSSPGRLPTQMSEEKKPSFSSTAELAHPDGQCMRPASEQWICDKCRKSYGHIASLSFHVKYSASCRGVARFACPRCGYASNRKAQLLLHWQSKQSSCPESDIKREGISNIAQVSSEQNCETARLKCREINKYRNTESDLTKQWACPNCSKSFGSLSSLRSHTYYSAGCAPDSRFACDNCDYATNKKSKLWKHQSSRRSCDMNIRHQALNKSQIVSSDLTEQWPCPKCSRPFPKRTALRNHLTYSVSCRPRARFRCSQCGYSSNRAGELRKHTSRLHAPKERSLPTTHLH